MRRLFASGRARVLLLILVGLTALDVLSTLLIAPLGISSPSQVALLLAADLLLVGLLAVVLLLVSRETARATSAAAGAAEQASQTRRQLAEIEAVYDTVQVGLAVLDADCRYARVNQLLADMNGLPVDAHTGRSLREVVPHFADQGEAIVRRVLESGQQVLDIEMTGETPAHPGETRVWMAHCRPLRDAEGRIFAVNLAVEDVTARQQAQRETELLLAEVLEERRRAESLAHELQAERDVLETIMENTSTRLAYLDPAFNFVRVNSAYARSAQKCRDELIGRNYFSIFPDDQDRVVFDQVWRTGEPAEQRARAYEHPDTPERGTRYWDWTLVPVKSGGGLTQGLVFSLSDVTEQKRAEEVLRSARDELEKAVHARTLALTEAIDALDAEVGERGRVEAQLRLILDQIPAILWTTDAEMRYTSVQGAGLRSLGIEPGDLSGLRVGATNSNAHEQEVVMDAHRRALAGESVTYRASWGNAYYEGYVQPLRDERGATTCCIGVALDVSRSRAAETALRSSEARFRAFFENAPVAVAIQDATGRIIEANPALETMLGYDRGALQSLAWSDFVHPDDVASDFDLFQEMMDGQRGGYQIEKRILPFAGEQRWVRLTVSVARDLTGHPHLIISMAEDITEAKAAARELTEREQQYRSIFESTSDGLVVVDLGGRIVDVNPAASDITGYARDEMTALTPADFVQPEQHRLFGRFLTLARDAERLETQTIGRRKGGQAFDLEVRASRFTYRGEPHLLGVVRDITERVRSIQLLEMRVKERTQELSTLLDISRSISATLEQRPLMALIADQLEQLVPASAVLLYTIDEDRLVLTEHRGFQRDLARDEYVDLSDPAIMDEARNRQEPYIAADLADVAFGGFAGAVYRSLTQLIPSGRSAIWAPLCAKGRVAGGLAIVDNRRERFEARDAELVSIIANQAAVALENARLYEQAQELAVLQERQRLARELHDSVTQALYSLVLMTEATRRLMAMQQTERITVFLGRIADTAQQVLKEMRLLVYELRPTLLARDGLISALRQRLQTVESRAGVEAQLVVHGSGYIPEQIEGELYRVAQEALNNSLKHSGATSVVVQLDVKTESVAIRVSDNGRGFDLAERGEGGMGLTSMRERAQRLGGELKLEAQAGKGTTVCLEIPTSSQEE